MKMKMKRRRMRKRRKMKQKVWKSKMLSLTKREMMILKLILLQKPLDVRNRMKLHLKFVIDGLAQKLFSNLSTRKFHRVPAKLENGHGLFSFTVEKEVNQRDGGGEGKFSSDKSTKIRGQRPVDHVIFDLAKFIGRGKVPSKVLKDVAELTSQTLSQAQNHLVNIGRSLLDVKFGSMVCTS
ncbi:hypothetical protein K1719_044406 [Acacia pycnantha]|nr:hypothetical protein K1719_044406 [Acacia pycnantha]